MDKGWVPHDEGLIGQTAERVIAGELPHRDFDDVYTGGLAYLNAGAMKVFGVNVRSPRIMLVVLFLACVPAFYYAALRFGSPLAAAATTLAGVAWSIPNYIASLPSWYNVIFALLGTAALLRFVDVGKRKWLFIAGLCAGLSILMKVVGLYLVAAVLLYLVFREQEGEGSTDATSPDASSAPPSRSVGYSALVVGGLLVFVLALLRLVSRMSGIDYLIHFVLPGTAMAAALVFNERVVSARRGSSVARLAALTRLVVPFIAGVVLPISIFLVPYVASGSVGDLIRGVFITPTLRLTFAQTPPLAVSRGLATLTVIALIFAAKRIPRAASHRLAIVLAIAGGYAVVMSALSSTTYRFVFNSAVLLPIAVVVAAAALLVGPKAIPSDRRQRLMIVAAVLSTFVLIQFPFAAPIYFCYVTPLLALGALAVVREVELPSPAVPGVLVATLIAFAFMRMHPGFLYNVGLGFARYQPVAPLPGPRGGNVQILSRASVDYTKLVSVVRSHAGSDSSYIYAAPDSPEVYFLTGLKNPTRTMYDFFDDPTQRTPKLLAALQQHDVRVIAINRGPEFSKKVDGELRAALERDYPLATAVGPFEVRWRE
jgi:hypothetical protein